MSLTVMCVSPHEQNRKNLLPVSHKKETIAGKKSPDMYNMCRISLKFHVN